MRELSYNAKVLFFVKAVENTIGLKGSEIAHVAGYSHSSYINWCKQPYKNGVPSVTSDCYLRAVCELYSKRFFAAPAAEMAACCSIFAQYTANVRMYYAWDETIMSDEYLSEGLNYIQSKFLGTDMSLFEKTKNYIFGGNN